VTGGCAPGRWSNPTDVRAGEESLGRSGLAFE